MSRAWQTGLLIVVALAAIGLSIWALADNARLFVVTALNGITLAALLSRMHAERRDLPVEAIQRAENA